MRGIAIRPLADLHVTSIQGRSSLRKVNLFSRRRFVVPQVNSKDSAMQLPLYHNGKRHLPLPSGK